MAILVAATAAALAATLACANPVAYHVPLAYVESPPVNYHQTPYFDFDGCGYYRRVQPTCPEEYSRIQQQPRYDEAEIYDDHHHGGPTTDYDGEECYDECGDDDDDYAAYDYTDTINDSDGNIVEPQHPRYEVETYKTDREISAERRAAARARARGKTAPGKRRHGYRQQAAAEKMIDIDTYRRHELDPSASVEEIVEDARPPRFMYRRRKTKTRVRLPNTFRLVAIEGDSRPLTRRIRIYRRRNGRLYFVRLYDDADDDVLVQDDRRGYDSDDSSDEFDDSQDSGYDRETAYAWVDAGYEVEVLKVFKGRHREDKRPSDKLYASK